MSTRPSLRLVAFLAIVGASFFSHSAQAQPSGAGAAKRKPWTTSRVKGSPEPPLPYITERAFPSLKFDGCLDLVAMPGSDRLLVTELTGKIFSFPNRADVTSADLFADLGKQIPGVQQVYSVIFHPDFEKNGYCYICYIKAAELPDGSHVTRFKVNKTNPPTLDLASETTIITWLSGGHNGCCLKFGPDGFLYISMGDGGPANPPDPKRVGQDVSDLLSSILRIDVDHAEGGKNYRIPPDNPFVSTKGARGEIWAYGLRNPWRMSFDKKSGDLWVGDVGWELWEMIDRIERGGNYGWAVMEGNHSANPEWVRGPSPILPPTVEHPHSESSSITDGLTYYGSRLKDLNGSHIYGDYDTGKFWAFRYENGKVVNRRELADTTHRVVSFGEDHAGEFFVLDHTGGTIHRLIPNPRAGSTDAFPKKLSDSGLYSSVKDLRPASGVLPYAINVTSWSDHATAERLVAIPDSGSIKAEGGTWTFPKDSVLVKTLSLELERGKRASRRRIETQLLHFDGIDWQPYTYVWNADQSDATLVGAAGAERTIEVTDPEAVGGKRRQNWRFSGRAECLRCHNRWSGPPLAFNAPQLNMRFSTVGPAYPQLETFANNKLLDRLLTVDDKARLARPSDRAASLDRRARSYLDVNCSHCHRANAGSAAQAKMTLDLPLDKTEMLNFRPTQGTFGIHDARVIAPGDPYRSVLLYRVSKLGTGRMPHIGSTEVDREGVDLIFEWISQMKNSTPSAEPVAKRRGSELADLDRLRQTKTPADRAEVVDRLLTSTSAAMMLQRSIDKKSLPSPVVSRVVEKGAHHAEVSVRDLFERYLPADQRVKRLGSTVQPEQILTIPGDAARGKQVFFDTAGVSCKNCHRIAQDGAEVGPELTTIGKKYDRARLLESILEPSKLIEPKYVTYLVETTDGGVVSGLLTERSATEVVLKDAQNKLVRIPVANVEQLVTQQQSLMPELLLRDMTAQQVADLLAYLGSLK